VLGAEILIRAGTPPWRYAYFSTMSGTVATAFCKSSGTTTGCVDEDAITADHFERVVLQTRILVSSGHTGVTK
jgi:hypothetical protein